nr:unnamed protein product [Ipomoea batatas]
MRPYLYDRYALNSLQAVVGLRLREAESDLRRRRLNGDAVPADTSPAHFMAVVMVLLRLIMVTEAVAASERVRGLARHVPREARDEQSADRGRGGDQHESSAEAAAGDGAVHFHRHYRRQRSEGFEDGLE